MKKNELIKYCPCNVIAQLFKYSFERCSCELESLQFRERQFDDTLYKNNSYRHQL